MNFEDLLKNKKEWSAKELADVFELARASGKTPFLTVVDDLNSPEGQAAKEYIERHDLLPPNYQDTTEAEILAQGNRLFAATTPISEKKKILMLLAHQGVYESYQILKKYNAGPDPELVFWARMALDECRTFSQQNLSAETLGSLTLIQSTGRNAPCGSGKKFKKCCGKG